MICYCVLIYNYPYDERINKSFNNKLLDNKLGRSLEND